MADFQQITPDPTSLSTSSDLSSTTSLKIPLLVEDGSNWVLYKAQFLTAVHAKGLRRYLEGRERMPTPTTAPGVDSEADERYETALDKWTANHATIKTLLFQTLPESLKLEVLTLTRAVDMWRVVTSRYDNQGDFVQVNILTQIQRLKCEEGADPRPVLAQLAKLRSEYATAGGTLSDEQYKVHILALLPLSYRPAVRAILASAQATGTSITSTALLTAINNIARDEHALEGEQSSTSALAARSGMRCFNCNKEGHTKAECWSKGGGKEGQGPKRRGRKKKSDNKGKGKEEKRESESAKAAAVSVPVVSDSMPQTLADATFWDESACLVATDFAKVSASPLKPTPHTRLVDSGASRHFDPHRSNFTTLRPITPIPINSADGRVFYATGEGDVRVAVRHGRHNINFMLRNVLYAPAMLIALMSVSQLVKSGFQVHFERDGCHITTPAGTSLPVITDRSGLYPLSGVQPSSEARAAEAAAAAMSQLEFHRRMGHAYPPTLRKMVSEGVVTGIELDAAEVDFCEVCIQAKQTREPFPKERLSPRAEAYGDRVHTDVWGKAQVCTWDGKEYFITFLDDHADEAFVSLMRTKGEALSRYRAYEAWVKSHRGVQEIKTIQSDRGGEYTSREFVEHLEKHGTTRRLTIHDSPQQNGKAERLNRTLVEHARALLFDAHLPKFLWGEAVLHACWLRNRTSGKNTPGTTPHEVATGEKPDLSNLPRFGAKCWILQQNIGKLDPKLKPGRWIGYSLESKGHKIYWPERRTVSIERDVRFEPETEVLMDVRVQSEGEPTSGSVLNAPDSPSASPSSPSSSPPSTPKPETPTTAVATPPSVPSSSPNTVPQKQTSLKPILAEQDMPKEPPVAEGRPKRERKPSAWVRNLQAGVGTTGGRGAQRVPPSILGEDAQLAAEFWEEMESEGELKDVAAQDMTAFDSPLFALAALGSDDEPTYREAMAGPEKEQWTAAMREELTRIEQLGTYELVERPPDANVVGAVWALRKKRNERNEVVKYKARLCAQGFSQVYGVDYTLTASPTAHASSFRLVLALAAKHDWETDVIDFKNAYLNSRLDDTIYMRQPPGFEVPGRERHVWRLLKALYGLKQAGLLWYRVVCALMSEIGLTRSEYDPGVFHLITQDVVIIIVIHVDDCILVTNSRLLMEGLKAQLAQRYEIVNLGEARWLLGYEIRRDRSACTVSLSQVAYIDTMLSRFNMTDAHPVSVPLDPHTNLFNYTLDDDERAEMRNRPYAQLIGSLMYAAITTRPDISFATSTLARLMADPATIHWEAAKRVLRYLKGTRNYVLMFGSTSDGLVGYTDADWGSQAHRHSISGYAFLYAGGAITWRSHKQPIIALSTTEAEYIAASDASREALWLRRLLALKLIRNVDVFHPRTKHIDIRYHFIRSHVADRTLALEYCPTNEMVADIFTKPLARPRLAMLAALLGLRLA
ncbi:hypothetical protein BN946_scf184844.g4 [Trametes cinnabarina]|uniref:Integrase catalytic domain-containing protein n=1 Tax=Pycnoporus cinnabarinus TaxID=5643 RepID=A0A060S9H3_PYCCI|nr:hypothetical protein BN946_scf184844.g4 [Trametes cinnabarina]